MRTRWTALLVFVSLLAGCSNKSSQDKVEAATKAQAPEPTAVRVATAETRSIGRSIYVTGSLQPDETVGVSSEVPGRVAEIRYDFGQNVRKGDVIAQLDKREFQLQYERARAALSQALARVGLDPNQEEASPNSTPAIRQASAQFEDAKFKYENAARLVKTGDISQERFIELEKAFRSREAALEAARDDLRMQLANVQALRAEVKLTQKRLEDTTIRAPFDGAVAAKLVSPGQYIKDNIPVVTLVKTNPLRLRVEVPEAAAGDVRLGTLLTFSTSAAPGAEFRAVVRELNPGLDAKSRSLTAEARLNNSDPRLKPGMFVQVQVAVGNDAAAVVVPREALYQIAGLTKVFTIRDGRAVENKITAGEDNGGWVEVPGDRIRPGDQVAVSKLPMLTDGAPVRPEAR